MTAGGERSFAQQLKQHRIARGLTQEELAVQAGLSVRGISDLERGLKTTPRRRTVELLVHALKLSRKDREALERAVHRRRGPRPLRPLQTAPDPSHVAGPPINGYVEEGSSPMAHPPSHAVAGAD